jgi:hypothetical protein
LSNRTKAIEKQGESTLWLLLSCSAKYNFKLNNRNHTEKRDFLCICSIYYPGEKNELIQKYLTSITLSVLEDRIIYTKVLKVKLFLYQAVETHRVVRLSHIFQTVCSQMAARLSALSASHPLPPGRFLVVISVRG